MAETSKQRPAQEVRIGAIRAAIWRNEGSNGPWFGVTFERLYTDEGNERKSSSSFGKDDLLVLAKVADQAHSWIVAQKKDDENAARS